MIEKIQDLQSRVNEKDYEIYLIPMNIKCYIVLSFIIFPIFIPYFCTLKSSNETSKKGSKIRDTLSEIFSRKHIVQYFIFPITGFFGNVYVADSQYFI